MACDHRTSIIAEANATTVVEPGWQAEVTLFDHLGLGRIEARPDRTAIGTRVDPVMLEVFRVDVGRRGDGPATGEYRLFGQPQRAARLFLRAVRCPGPIDRQRAASSTY
jgi:hypothetical protein